MTATLARIVLAATSRRVVSVAAVLCACLAGTSTATARAARAGALTPAKLAADLVAGAALRKAPANLEPSLSTALQAWPVILRNGCHLGHPQLVSPPCVYGDRTSRTSVVLFGDSHAAAWFPALQVISKKRHWRLVDLTKSGCPPVEVNIIFSGHRGPYPQCAVWRRNAQAQISALHPALVVAVWARVVELPEATSLAGVPKRYGSLWQDGVAAAFRFLHRSARHVAFISDSPTMTRYAPSCVAAHRSDVRRCATPRRAAVRYPRVKQQELELAAAAHVSAIDPTSWFCDPTTCPVIVGNILLYRDGAHMTPAWSRFIAPVLQRALMPIMRG